MRLFLSLLFASLCSLAGAGTFPAVQNTNSPAIILDVSRPTGCVAPCAEFFSAIGTTSPGVTYPYHDIEYTWNFGDTPVASSTWGYGSRAGVSSRNTAYGANAGHVYETAGTYYPCVTANDGTNTNTVCSKLVVDAADTVFAGNKTICFYNTTLGDGCPAGADTQAASSFYTAMGIASVSGTHAPYGRVLFKAGDSFTAGTTYILERNGPGIIGSYGAGARPAITATANSVTILQMAKSTASGFSDWRVMDLEMIGDGTDNGVSGVQSLYAFDRITLLRLNVHGLNKGLFVSNVPHDEIAMVDNESSNITGAGGSLAVYAETNRLMIIGNNFNSSFGGEHVVRVQACYRCVISNNTMQGAGAVAGSKHAFTLRSAVHNQSPWANSGDAQYIIMSDNLFIGSPGGQYTVFNGPQAADDERIVDTIFERNWIQAGSGQTEALHLSTYARNTVRNNVIDLTGAAAHMGINVKQYATAVYPDATWIYNNTFYSADTDNDFDMIDVSSVVTNTIVRNNLGYAPNDSAHAGVTCNGSSTLTSCTNAPGNLVHSNNSTALQIRDTSPLFTSVSPFTPTNAKPTCTGTTYPCAQGTAVPLWSDFFLVPQPALRDMGAVIH